MSLIDNFFEAFRKKDLDALSDLLTEDYVLVDPYRDTVTSKGEWLSNLSSLNTNVSEIRVIYDNPNFMAVHYSITLENGKQKGFLSVSILDKEKIKRTELGITTT
tara:strand:- start:161 stop:475 length:315 start_codon:yes stop_codon:yes gene_type:complete